MFANLFSRLVLLVVVVVVLDCCSLSHSAPSKSSTPFRSCLNLTPEGGSSPSQPSGTSPFLINATAYYNEESKKQFVYVEIISPNASSTFEGFGVQARLGNNPDIVVDGEFVPSDSQTSRAYGCKLHESMVHNNTWTHTNTEPKNTVKAFWYPAKISSDPIVFYGTIIQNSSTYWTEQQSEKIDLSVLAKLTKSADLAINGTDVDYETVNTDDYEAMTNSVESTTSSSDDAEREETISGRSSEDHSTNIDQIVESKVREKIFARSTSTTVHKIHSLILFILLLLGLSY